jgi:multiple sugar transport system substrate-binding protein
MRIRRQHRDLLRGGLKSRLTIGAVALALVGGFATVAATDTTAATAHKSSVVHLTWWTMWSGSSLTAVNKIVAAWNKAHPTIQVTEQSIPSVQTTSTAQLLSAIAAGDPPSLFTEWWPEIGSFAADGDLTSLNQFLTGPYKGFEKWLYPVAVQGGSYKGKLVAVPQALNSWALYYNKTLMAKYGITSPPTTLAELQADQAKAWVTSNGQLQQLGFYPDTDGNSFEFYTPFFGDTNCIKNGKYDFESPTACPGGIAEMNFFQSYAQYSYSQVMALQTALGTVAGGSTDIWGSGKSMFMLSGPWEGQVTVPSTDPSLEGNFGVEAFPGNAQYTGATLGQGNFNIIPKGAAHAKDAFEFMAWMSGYGSRSQATAIAKIDTQGGWVPGGPSVTKLPVYKAWIAANPWLKGFLPEETNKHTAAPVLTPTNSQLFTAEDTASANVLQGTMTPLQALQYIDQQGNS